MTVQFYTFRKRSNSTMRPNVEPVLVVDAIMRNESSVVAPVLELHKSSAINTRTMNYVYIPAYDRYYFVQDWTWNAGIWEISLTEDVLASWRDTIGSTNDYVTRSSYRFNGNIHDRVYPFSGEISFAKNELANLFTENDLHSSGFYVVEVVGGASSNGLKYYALEPLYFRDFMWRITSHEYLDSIVPGASASQPELEIDLDPLQYIKSVRWYPFAMPAWTHSIPGVTINVGYGSVTFVGATSPYIEITGDFIIELKNSSGYPVTALYGSHPQSVTRGAYLNKEPFTDRTLFYPPFGIISLDADTLSESDGIVLDMFVDIRTGAGMLNVWSIDISGETITRKIILTHSVAQIGIPVATNQVFQAGFGGIATSQAVLEMAGNITNGLSNSGVTAAPMTGLSVFSSMLNIEGKYQASKIPSLTTNGTTGSLVEFTGDPVLISEYRHVVDDDNEQRGRPLCEKVQIRTIPGYIVIADPDFSCNGTSEEIDKIREFMGGGFYYE